MSFPTGTQKTLYLSYHAVCTMPELTEAGEPVHRRLAFREFFATPLREFQDHFKDKNSSELTSSIENKSRRIKGSLRVG